MNRRGFLGAILAAGVAPAVVRAVSLMPLVTRPSGLVLPAHTSLDVLYGYKAPSILTIEMITAESLRILKNNLSLAGSVDARYSDEFARSSTLRVYRPRPYPDRKTPRATVIGGA